MYDPQCVRCRQARNAGYDGCTLHNRVRGRWYPPTVGVMGERYEPPVGVDVADGDLVVNLGGGIGVDTRTGDVEFEVAPGVYVDPTDF